MTQELQIIDERTVLGKDFKVYGTVEKPLFLARDVAEWIDYSINKYGKRNVSKMISTVDESEKVKLSFPTITNSKARKKSHKTDISTADSNVDSRLENLTTSAWFLTDDGLYEVLMTSRKPIAKQFKKEVKKILKEIRLTGGYVANDDVFIQNYLPFADEQTKLLFKTTLQTVKKLNEQIEQNAPKVLYADAVLDSDDTSLIREFAKYLSSNGVDIGGNRLYSWLRDNGYLIKEGSDRNLPTQKSMELGLFVVTEAPVWNYGKCTIYKTAKVTAKGRIYFLNKFLGKI